MSGLLWDPTHFKHHFSISVGVHFEKTKIVVGVLVNWLCWNDQPPWLLRSDEESSLMVASSEKAQAIGGLILWHQRKLIILFGKELNMDHVFFFFLFFK